MCRKIGLGLGYYARVAKACGAAKLLSTKIIQRKETPLSRICNLKDETRGGSKFNPLIPRTTNYAKTGMGIGTQDSNVGELTNTMIQGTIINLPAENKDYLVKYNYDHKIVFSGKDAVVNESINALNGRVDGRLGSVREYSTLVGAQSEQENLYPQNGIEIPKGSNWMSESKETPLSRICNLKDETRGGSKFNPLIRRTNYAKTGMGIGTQDSNVGELTNTMKQGTIINLPAENKDYLVKYNYDHKIVFSGKDAVVNESINALNGRFDGRLGSVREYSTLVGAQSEQENLYPQNGVEIPKGSNWMSESKGTSYVKKGMAAETQEEDDELTDIKEGDIINLQNLLFTEKRDYLVKYNGQKVKAEQLVGKGILLYFVPVYLDDSWNWEKECTAFLIDIYNDLLPNNDFEVILVAIDDLCAESLLVSQQDLQKKFESIFAGMPWTAIPFSDIASRKRIERKLSVCGFQGGKLLVTSSISLDSEGMVLKRDACHLFGEYGTPGYPFTDKRIEFLDSADDAIAEQPSLELLLASPERDYVISNKGDRVPIHTLKDKVVAMYFYEEFYEDGLTNYRCVGLTEQLKTAYKELAEKKENFEVVFLYLYDTQATLHRTNEESFWKTFKTMPWLALPYKDSNHKKLKRIFGYPDELAGSKAPTLVIFGPNGEFVDPCGADILEKFGTFVYPFTRKKVAQLETKMTKELKLEMLWDPNTVFRVKKYGLQVLPKIFLLLGLVSPSLQIPFSQFAGKRLLLYFQMNEYVEPFHWNRLLRLKDIYLKMKGTYDEFEVIYIKDSSSTKVKQDLLAFLPDYSELPWLVHDYRKGYSLPKELERCFFNLNCSSDQAWYRHSSLVAFDRDGRIVRKTFSPTFNDIEFPFYAGGLEKECMVHLNHTFQWHYWSNQIIYRTGKW